ncbi:MAG: hypothetical protein HY778_01850 [Betaproteobacteria bacterium]|nr:hypothetical protein [Betaproteobacteria bacterium]
MTGHTLPAWGTRHGNAPRCERTPSTAAAEPAPAATTARPTEGVPAQRRIDADTVVFIATAVLTLLAFTLIP